MNILEKSRNFLTKLQGLPEDVKKLILWTIVTILAIIMGYFWIQEVRNSTAKMEESVKSINLPTVDLPALPSTDILQTTTPSNK